MADEERRKICIDAGDGIGFTNSEMGIPDYAKKLTIDVADAKDIVKTSTGLYIGDRTGKTGYDGGSTVDGYTLIEETVQNTKFPAVNRDVVTLIHSLCAYVIGERTQTKIVMTSTVKKVVDIMTEYNRAANYRGIKILPGDLLQLMTLPIGVSYNDLPMAESFDRCPTMMLSAGYKTLVLFVVNSVAYTHQNLSSLHLTCLYSAIPEFTRGDKY